MATVSLWLVHFPDNIVNWLNTVEKWRYTTSEIAWHWCTCRTTWLTNIPACKYLRNVSNLQVSEELNEEGRFQIGVRCFLEMYSSRWHLHLHAARKNAGARNIFPNCRQRGWRRLRRFWSTYCQICLSPSYFFSSAGHAWEFLSYNY